MTAKIGAFPANLVIGDILWREYRAIGIDTAALMARCDEGVQKIVFVQCVVEVYLVGKPGIALLGVVQGRSSERKAVEEKLSNAARGEISLGITRAGLQFQGIGKGVTALCKDAPARSDSGVLQAIERHAAGWRAARRQ